MSAAVTMLPSSMLTNDNTTIIVNTNMEDENEGLMMREEDDQTNSPSPSSRDLQPVPTHYDDSDDVNDASGVEAVDDDVEDLNHHRVGRQLSRPDATPVAADVERPSMLSDRPSMLSEPTFVDRPSMIGGGDDSREMVMVMMDEDDSSSHDGTTSNSLSMIHHHTSTNHHKVPHKRGKRKKYQKYTPEDRIAIGKYCFEHGPAAARKAFQDRYPEMSESVTRGFRDKYKQMIGESAVYEFEQKRQKELQNSYTPPPRGRPRKYKVVEEPLDYPPSTQQQQRPSPPLQQEKQQHELHEQEKDDDSLSMIKDTYHRYPSTNSTAHLNGTSRSVNTRPYSMAAADEKGGLQRRPTFFESSKPQQQSPTRVTKITREDQLKIGRYCSLHGVMKALQEYHKEYPGISEAIIFDFHKQYQRHKQEQDHLRHNNNNNNNIKSASNNNNKNQNSTGGYHSPPYPGGMEHAQEYHGNQQPQVFVLEGDQMPPTTAATAPSPSIITSKPTNGSISPNGSDSHISSHQQQHHHDHHHQKRMDSPVLSPRSHLGDEDEESSRRSPFSNRSPPPPHPPPASKLTTRAESRSPPYSRQRYESGGERIRYSTMPPSRESPKDELPSPPLHHHTHQQHLRRRSRSPPLGMQHPHSPRMRHHSPSPRSIRHSPNGAIMSSSKSSTSNGGAPPIIHYPRPRPHSPGHNPHSPPHHSHTYNNHGSHHLHRSVSENHHHLRDYDVIPPRVNGYPTSVEYPYDRKEFHPKSQIGNNQSGGRSKRFKYQKYTPEDRYNIGKLCNDIGLGATVKVYREQFPRLNESVVRTFRNKYRELLEKGGGVPATETIERKPSRRSISTLIEGEVVSQLKQFHSSQIELSENFVIAVAENVIATKHQKEAENVKGIVTKEWANSLLWKHKLLDKPSGNVQGVCCERCKTILVCPKCPP